MVFFTHSNFQLLVRQLGQMNAELEHGVIVVCQ